MLASFAKSYLNRFKNKSFFPYSLSHFLSSSKNISRMRIVPVPLNSDNYGYLILDDTSKECAVVDVSGQPDDIIHAIRAEGSFKLTTVLTTHHHWDHAGGNAKMREMFSDVKIFGSHEDNVEGCTNFVSDGEEFVIGSSNILVRCLLTPGHTKGHISYFVQDGEHRAVFTGDCLFIGGAGKFFEGTGRDMHPSLYEKLAQLHPETLVYCGHEYTLSNYRFCLSIEPDNQILLAKNELAISLRAENKPTVPSTIRDELDTNVFLRVNQPTIQRVFHGLDDPADILSAIREAKNNFK